MATCLSCGVEFRRTRSVKTQRKCCSRACGFAYLRRVKTLARLDLAFRKAVERKEQLRDCLVCGERCHRPSAIVCRNDACRKRVAADRAPHGENCQTCSASLEYRAGKARSKFCSARCRRRSTRARADRRRYRLIDKVRRRTRMRGLLYEAVDPFKVFERDGWHCVICGCSTPREKRGSYENDAPELDHVIPLARGGSHTYANTQCACRDCNIKKGSAIAA